MKKLCGQVAVVTGAARGIGRTYALKLAELGADVAVLDINLQSYKDFENESIQEDAETVVDEIEKLNSKTLGIEVDISDESAVLNAFKEIEKKLGPVNILVANAGGGSGSIAENKSSQIDLEQIKLVMARNLYGTIHSVKAVVENMKKNNNGKIVTVTSVAGMKATPDGSYSHYGATKSAIINYTKYLSQELGPYNINVNAIAPGYIATGRLMEQFKKNGIETYENETALRRLGTPEDCAKVIEFLTTDLSDYVTGNVIDVTGGLVK